MPNTCSALNEVPFNVPDLERSARCCPGLSRLVARRIGVYACCAFWVRLSEIECEFVHVRRERQEVPMFSRAGHDITFISARDFSYVSEMGPVAGYRYRSVMQNPPSESVLK